jgi:hypothetical protein
MASETVLANLSGASRTVTIDFGQNNFTLPVGATDAIGFRHRKLDQLAGR